MPNTRSANRLNVTQNANNLPNNGNANNGCDTRSAPGIRNAWTDQMRRDLLLCYTRSEPNKRNYMDRLHSNWLDMRPEYSHYSKVTLRNQLAYIRKHPRPEDNTTNQECDTNTDEQSAVDMTSPIKEIQELINTKAYACQHGR